MGQIVELRVEGMDCAACERRLAAVLGGLDGVGGVEADHTTGGGAGAVSAVPGWRRRADR